MRSGDRKAQQGEEREAGGNKGEAIAKTVISPGLKPWSVCVPTGRSYAEGLCLHKEPNLGGNFSQWFCRIHNCSLEIHSWQGGGGSPFFKKAFWLLLCLFSVFANSSKAYWDMNLCLHCGSLKTIDMNNSFQLVAGYVQSTSNSAIIESLNFRVTHGFFYIHRIASNIYIKPLTIDDIFLKLLVKLTVLTNEDNFYKINMFILNLPKSASFFGLIFLSSATRYLLNSMLGAIWRICTDWTETRGWSSHLGRGWSPGSSIRGSSLERYRGVIVRGAESFYVLRRKLLGLSTILLKIIIIKRYLIIIE